MSALAAALACACMAQAETAAAELPELTNTATRTERRVADTPASVSVLRPAGDARDLKDLLRHELDLSVRAANPRFGLALGATGRAGNEGLNIRGLEGNQVLLMVDGIRMPQSFSFGPFVTGRAGLLNLEGAASADVLRGPASTSFGSDGLAGALALRTLDVTDLLRPGQATALRAQLSTHSVDDGHGLNLAGAWRGQGLDALLQASHRRSHEVATQGENRAENASRTAPEPLQRERYTALGKLGLALDATQRLQFTLEGVEQQDRWDVLSARSATVLRLDADDRSRRQRAALAWSLEDVNAAAVQQAGVTVYQQRAEVRQAAIETRPSLAPRTRDNRYEESLKGLTAQLQSSQGAQRYSAGLDASANRIRALRDGLVPPAGESLPAKPFPDTEYRLIGAFAQAELEMGRGLQMVPALRYERFALDPSAHGFGAPVVALQDAAWSPRLGLLWRHSPGFAPFLQWARGFKAPQPSQVNSGFANPVHHYRSIGNPNLRAERAESRELGLRGAQPGLGWQLALYDNEYEDFISQERVAGTGAPGNPLVFQSINLAGARIRGLEARLDWRPDAAWRLGLSLARSRGEVQRAAQRSPLDSVEPGKLALHVRQQLGLWHWELDLLHTQRKAASQVAAQTPFLPPGYTVADLRLGWQFSSGWSLLARVDNLTDRKYWQWADVRGLTAGSTVLDAFGAPGRQFGLLLQTQL